jgi:hypothetical protein
MRSRSAKPEDQELMLALFAMIIILPALPDLVSRNLACVFFILQLQWRGIIRWKLVLKRFLAPLAFLTLSSLALLLGPYDKVFDVFNKGLIASFLLLVLSHAFQGHQWLEWGWRWKIDTMLLTLAMTASRWIQISQTLWAAMDKGWTMRSQLSACRSSMRHMGWRLTRVYHLHEQRIVATDLGWAARGLEPILPVRTGHRLAFSWSTLALYLAPTSLVYACTTLLLQELS